MVEFCTSTHQSVAVTNLPYSIYTNGSVHPRLPNVFSLDQPPMLWTNTEYLADASDDNVSEVGHPTMTFVHTSCLEVDANSSQISLTDNKFIQYVTNDNDTKDSTEAKGDVAA